MTDTTRDAFEAIYGGGNMGAVTYADFKAGWQAATEQGKRQPLTGEQLRDVARAFKGSTQQRLRDHWDEVEAFVREVEAAHGITATPPQGKI